MSHPRGLTPEEAAIWERVAATVKPLHPARLPKEAPPKPASPPRPAARKIVASTPPAPMPSTPHVAPRRRGQDVLHTSLSAPPLPAAGAGLDSHWDRRFKGGAIEPDFTLDLHGHNLEAAHRRLDDGLLQAKAMGARVVLLVTGKPRPVDHADRAERRGAIRAKILDWLAAGPHGPDIAAVRGAHRKHGGQGALYIVLKRRR